MAFNICTVENGARILRSSSQSNSKHAPAENVLKEDRSLVWTSGQGMPQYLIIDLRRLKKRSKEICWVGFDLWHDYDSNPRFVQLQIKKEDTGDDNDFITWVSLQLARKVGKQFFPLDPISSRFGLIKIVIKDTYGASKTYLNQFMLYSSNPTLEEESRVRTSTDNVSSRWKRDGKYSRRQQSEQLHPQEEQAVRSHFRRAQLAENFTQSEEAEDPKDDDQSGEVAFENARMKDSLSGIAQSRQQSDGLNTVALLSHNLMGVEENMQVLYRKIEHMSLRLDETEKRQQDIQARLADRLQKYVDRKLEEREKLRTEKGSKKDSQIQKLIRELNEKLVLRERKLNKLKNSR